MGRVRRLGGWAICRNPLVVRGPNLRWATWIIRVYQLIHGFPTQSLGLSGFIRVNRCPSVISLRGLREALRMGRVDIS